MHIYTYICCDDCSSNRCYVCASDYPLRFSGQRLRTHAREHVHLGPRKTPLARLVWHAQCKRRRIAAAAAAQPWLRSWF